MASQPTHLDNNPIPSSQSNTTIATETMASLPIPATLQEKPLPPSNTPTLFSSDPDSDCDPEKLPRIPSDSDSNPEKSLQPRSSPSPVDVHPSRASPFKWALILLALYISAFLYGLDTTIAADIQGPVISTFPLDGASKFSWIGFGFPLGSVAVILLVSNLYASFNMKWLYILSVLLFEVGSVICGAAPNMDALIVGRVLTGMGGSGIYLGVLNYITLLTEDTERGFYISLTGFSWGVGAVLGPVIGGSFAGSERTTWRWAFYINLVVGAAVAPVYFWCLPGLNLGRGKNLGERVRAFDWLGLGLFAAVWATFTVGFSSAGVRWAWSDASSITLVVVFGVVLLALVVQQYFAIGTTKETRAFPGHLLKSRTQVLLYVATAATSSALFVVTYYIPIYFQFVHSDSPIKAAVRLLPFIIVNVTSNVLSGRLLSKVRYYMPIFLVGGALVTIGSSLLMVKLDPATGAGAIYGFSIIVAIGSGLTIQLGYAVATLTVKPADIGNALSMQNVSQIGSSAISLVVAGQIFQSVAIKNLEAALGGHGYSSEQIATAVTGAQSEIFQLLGSDLRAAAVDAIVGAMQKSFILVIVAGAALFVSAALMKRERLFGEIVVA